MFEGFLWGFQGSFKSVSRKFQGCFMKLSRRRKFQDVSRVVQYFQASFQYVLEVFQVCSKKLSGRSKKVSCCMVLIVASPCRRRACFFFNFKIEGLFFDCIFLGYLLSCHIAEF